MSLICEKVMRALMNRPPSMIEKVRVCSRHVSTSIKIASTMADARLRVWYKIASGSTSIERMTGKAQLDPKIQFLLDSKARQAQHCLACSLTRQDRHGRQMRFILSTLCLCLHCCLTHLKLEPRPVMPVLALLEAKNGSTAWRAGAKIVVEQCPCEQRPPLATPTASYPRRDL